MESLNIKVELIYSICENIPDGTDELNQWAARNELILPSSRRKWNGKLVISWLRDAKELWHYTEYMEEEPPDEIIEFATKDEDKAPHSPKAYREEVEKHPRVYIASIDDAGKIETLYVKYIAEEDIVGFDVSPSGKSIVFVTKNEDWATALLINENGVSDLVASELDDAPIENLRFVNDNEIELDDAYEEGHIWRFGIENNKLLQIG